MNAAPEGVSSVGPTPRPEGWLRRIDPLIVAFVLTVGQFGVAMMVGAETVPGAVLLMTGLMMSPVLAVLFKVWQQRGRR